jgi:hypothetical protein
MTYKEELLQDVKNCQKNLEWAKKNLEWAKANFEYETLHVKRVKLSLIWAELRIYGNEVGYNKIHKKQTEWCNRLWDILTEQIEIAHKKMMEATAK